MAQERGAGTIADFVVLHCKVSHTSLVLVLHGMPISPGFLHQDGVFLHWQERILAQSRSRRVARSVI
jgi:hypothetical protein